MSKSKIHHFGPEVSVYDDHAGFSGSNCDGSDGQIFIVCSDLFLLISGKLTAWCKDVPLHSIIPGDFINSVEWISLEEGEVERNQQIMAYSDEESTILKVHTIKHYFLIFYLD